MAPIGKLYTVEGNPRSVGIRVAAHANNLELEIVDTPVAKGPVAGYEKINPLMQIPSFVGTDGFTLYEAIAIAIYVTSQNEKTTLLGKTKQDYATILKWMSFFNFEVLPKLGQYFRPLIGRDPYNKKSVEDGQKASYQAIAVIEEHLKHNTYLAGERITLADLFGAGIITRGFQYLLDKKWRAENPNTARWFETITNQPSYLEVIGKAVLVEEALKNQPPKKPEQPKKEAAPKAAPKPKAKEAEEEEEEAPAAPKAKHPLEALPKPTLVLDEWKRQYSNNDTPIALKWFWENYKPDEYSLWRVDYKYPEELTQVFMTSNLIGGFFARLEASRKYIFGCASVYGQANDSVIQGAFVIRGHEALPAFDVAPDYESYEFTRLDENKPEDKQFVEDQWTWEKPVVVNGKEYPWADGKVFK
ncbi:40S ribosomal protein S3aE [Xylogone sp. PMI_703]|nr:40S ribosomal protein S3aE [Xylogone sp. PMI_703]